MLTLPPRPFLPHRQVVKKKETVPKIFKCPYCAHEGSCEVKMDRATETGTVTCRVCGETFQDRISALSDPVDVMCAWLDALDRSRGGGGGAGGGGATGGVLLVA